MSDNSSTPAPKKPVNNPFSRRNAGNPTTPQGNRGPEHAWFDLRLPMFENVSPDGSEVLSLSTNLRRADSPDGHLALVLFTVPIKVKDAATGKEVQDVGFEARLIEGPDKVGDPKAGMKVGLLQKQTTRNGREVIKGNVLGDPSTLVEFENRASEKAPAFTLFASKSTNRTNLDGRGEFTAWVRGRFSQQAQQGGPNAAPAATPTQQGGNTIDPDSDCGF